MTKKILLGFPQKLVDRIEEYQRITGFNTRTDAIFDLIRRGFDSYKFRDIQIGIDEILRIMRDVERDTEEGGEYNNG